MKNKFLAFILCSLVVFVFGCGPTKLELIFEVKDKEIVATNFGLETDHLELEEAVTEPDEANVELEEAITELEEANVELEAAITELETDNDDNE